MYSLYLCQGPERPMTERPIRWTSRLDHGPASCPAIPSWGTIRPMLRLSLRHAGIALAMVCAVARATGADVVIAVNLGSPLLEPKALGSIVGVTEQMLGVLTQQNVAAALALLRPTDIPIEPELGPLLAR